MKRLIGYGALALLLATPGAAPAQFGGLGKLGHALGGGVSTGDGEAFLLNAAHSTKNVMISAALLTQAVTNRADLTGAKATIDALNNAQSVKELDAHRDELASNLQVLDQRGDLSGDIAAAYNQGDDQQKKLIGLAVANLAIGIARNTQLAGQAPGMVKGISRNPALATRIGEFKAAAELLGLQAKGLKGIMGSVPKLLAAANVQGPAASATSEPQPISL